MTEWTENYIYRSSLIVITQMMFLIVMKLDSSTGLYVIVLLCPSVVSVYKSTLHNFQSMRTPYSERFGPAPIIRRSLI